MVSNIFLDKKWQESHVREIKNKAGHRYTPKLNVDLPIVEIFDGISRTKNFYYLVREHYGKLMRAFGRVSGNYETPDAQTLYENLKSEISQLSNTLSEIKSYNIKRVPWSQINKHTQKANEILWKLADKLREERTRQTQKSGEVPSNLQSISGKLEADIADIHYLYEAQKELRFFEELSLSTKAKLSNLPFLILTGDAGTGKTHLLCDLVENRLKEGLPAVIVFGEYFTTTDEPLKQITQQIGLKEINKDQFLSLLNDAGKQSGCRAILAIDALNETRQQDFWKRNLKRVVDEIKKYPHIALVVSVRTGFEKEVITKKLKTTFVCEEHRGFEFREWEAISKFFKEFQLPLPEIPLLMPEFQNPLFLLLFCKAYQSRTGKNKGKKQRQVFRGHEGATYIFESFVDSVSEKIAKQFSIPNGPGKNIWDKIIEKIAEQMVEKNDDRISEDELIVLVEKAYPSIDDHSNLIKEMERSLLIVKVPRYSKEKNDYDGFDFRFPFQKFSDHLIGRYIFKRYEQEFGKANKNLQTAKKFFSKRKKFLANLWNRGIIEALSIQCPEHLNGCELVEVVPYLKDSQVAQEAFVESLIWRKPTAFSKDLKNTLDYINREIIITESGRNNLLNAFLTIASVPNHPFNADFLHKHLSRFSMPKRDSWWSTFLHYQYSKKGAVDRLIEWGWSDEDKSHINDESIRLCSVALIWFLSTPNRFLRDKATKALVALLTNRLSIVLTLLKKFKDVNDPYVAERLYAVAYGCAIRSKNDSAGLKNLSQWIYDEIFKNGNPPVHILLRDYARGIIEVALRQNISLQIDERKIIPPFNTKWPSRFPSNKTIKKYEFDYEDKNFKDYFWAQNAIIYSMQPESSEIFMVYGDFGRYTFQSAISHFQYPNHVTMQKLSNWATKRVFNLGYDVKLHGNFDRTLNRYHNDERSEHKPERIGKKYQWIALHELLALSSDHFQIKDETTWLKEKTLPYEGPWQLSVRDIDPSCILKEFPNTKPKNVPNFKWEFKNQYNVWHKNSSHSAWLKNSRDLPDPREIIEFVGERGIVWVALERSVEWQEEAPPEQEKYKLPRRTLWYMVKSYLVRAIDKDKVFKWANRQHFMGRWMPESHEFYDVYLGEYTWPRAFLYHNVPYYCHDGWTDKAENKKIPAKILVTDDQYSSSGSSRDCSTNEAIGVKLPAKFIVDEMELTQDYVDGRFFDKFDKEDNKEDNLVAFDPGVFDDNAPNCVLIRKDKLCGFLKQKGYALLWILLGEKNMIGGGIIGQPLGRLEIDGAYILNEKDQIVGIKRSSFKK